MYADQRSVCAPYMAPVGVALQAGWRTPVASCRYPAPLKRDEQGAEESPQIDGKDVIMIDANPAHQASSDYGVEKFVFTPHESFRPRSPFVAAQSIMTMMPVGSPSASTVRSAARSM